MRRTDVGFVFQAFHLMDELTAVENVELAGCSPRSARRRAEQLLEQVGLADRARFLPSALSGGQRQRVAVATAIKPRSLRSGSCSPWYWRPCSWWRRSPLFPPASADAVR
jgi:putative ABC transport system ATP-binding protein